jgi:hypothetical protein
MRDHNQQNQPYLAVVAGVKTKHRLSFCPGRGWRGRGRGRPLEGTHATASSPHTLTHTHDWSGRELGDRPPVPGSYSTNPSSARVA